jgi:hypothetical protein
MPEPFRSDEWRCASRKPDTGKPRLAFFRPALPNLPVFVRQHLDEHVRCLGIFFDVVLIEENCSFDEVCDRLRPDLALFESGVYVRPDRWITDTHCHPEIPKIGLLNADAYCVTRSVFLSDMDEWGVETFFTISMALRGRASTDLRERLFAWPNFADSNLYRTYHGEKRTRILRVGSHAAHYPWRTRVNHLLSERFAMDTLAHGGWFDAERTRNMLSGESYARALSTSLIIPTCGTVAGELVRKHFEIPASGALLLTERTAALKAAGFADMQTCVFADEADVVDKVEYLLKNLDEIARISAAGQKLAHDRHDMAHRNQIFQWYELNKRAGPNEKIIQPDPFDDMRIQAVGETEPQASETVGAGQDWVLLQSGDRALSTGLFNCAQSKYRMALNYHYAPEPVVGLIRLALHDGNAIVAMEHAWDLILRICVAAPDPVEWSLYTISLLCAGRVSDAVRAARQYDRLAHVELARARHLVHRLTGTSASAAPDRPRLSIHHDRGLSWAEWVVDVARMLAACGQAAFAREASTLSREHDPAREMLGLASTCASRKVGRRHPKLRRQLGLGLGIRPRIARWRYRQAATPQLDNPFAEIITTRGIRTVALVGLASGDPVREWARVACRASPRPCALVLVGDPPDVDASAHSIRVHGDSALGDDASFPLAISGQCIVIVGPAACEVSSIHRYRDAGVVVVANARDRFATGIVAELDADRAWRRITLGDEIDGLGLVVWERAHPEEPDIENASA